MEGRVAHLEREVIRLRSELQCEGIRLRSQLNCEEIRVRSRFEQQESRMRSDVERLERSFAALLERQRERSRNRALLACYLVVTAALYGAMAVGFGWI